MLCYNSTVKKGQSAGGPSASAFSLPKFRKEAISMWCSIFLVSGTILPFPRTGPPFGNQCQVSADLSPFPIISANHLCQQIAFWSWWTKVFPLPRKSFQWSLRTFQWMSGNLCYNGTVRKGKSVGSPSAGAFSLHKLGKEVVPMWFLCFQTQDLPVYSDRCYVIGRSHQEFTQNRVNNSAHYILFLADAKRPLNVVAGCRQKSQDTQGNTCYTISC